MQATAQNIKAISASLILRKIFYCVIALCALSLSLAMAGYFLGHTISLGGHTEDISVQEIVIGNDVLQIPANMIRFDRQRRDGIADRVDLYLHWPDMQGYTPELKDDFNGAGSGKRLLFLTFEERQGSQDMSGRYGPVYLPLTEGPGIAGPADLTIQRFRSDSGFVNEELLVAPDHGAKRPFVARCLDEQSSRDNLASCQSDIFIGSNLQLTYRFPREMLGDWRLLDKQIKEFARGHIKSAE
ncbi:hypothetical protein [Phyllobacterium sp. YR531]|uniref:hypothetical protein n=1 Tax=Phyllobacterium sp. YR531 TaxID=1144343 RepID=UPI00026FC352|nr:hypothetical protein [Phyllobacterium sp. YR531]EJN04847.1 hypothetical protein PMI41_01312 [Phyllobacterium sp. YR531]